MRCNARVYQRRTLPDTTKLYAILTSESSCRAYLYQRLSCIFGTISWSPLMKAVECLQASLVPGLSRCRARTTSRWKTTPGCPNSLKKFRIFYAELSRICSLDRCERIPRVSVLIFTAAPRIVYVRQASVHFVGFGKLKLALSRSWADCTSGALDTAARCGSICTVAVMPAIKRTRSGT